VDGGLHVELLLDLPSPDYILRALTTPLTPLYVPDRPPSPWRIATPFSLSPIRPFDSILR
jgi:hypothetical protein